MGSQESKSAEQNKENDEIKETELNDSAPSSPILTPLDPRSPSTNIARTPLELILRSKTNAAATDEGSVDLTTEENGEEVKNVILNLDPRSPTAEFNRTPIIVSTVVKGKLNNKNFDNVRKNTIQTTPTTTQKSKVVPPKFLGSSPVYVNPNFNKRRSLVGLLETNIDFRETNLDNVCTNTEQLFEDSPKEVAEEECTEGDSDEIENQIESLHLESDDLKSTPDQTLTKDEEKNKESQNSLPEVELKKTEHDNILEEKSINITAHVKDFDKKLTNLIYQDESEDDDKLSTRFARIKENNRTPLGVRNSNEEPKKPVSRLKVSDKPRKSEISKIPVFKDTHSKKIGVQCENTPPKKTEEKRIKSKVTQWDADKTLII